MKKGLCAFVTLAILATAGNAYASAVPEIDASGAVTALSFLAGVVALAAERLRRKKLPGNRVASNLGSGRTLTRGGDR